MKHRNTERSATETSGGIVLDETEALNLLSEAVESRKVIFAKILSRNDSSWANDRGKHQAGPYIPADVRERFFPRLKRREDKHHILETNIRTVWPQVRDSLNSRLVHYSNKGSETHLTGVPKRVFANLNPASLLVMWNENGPSAADSYVCLVFNSAGEAYLSAFEVLDLSPEFTAGVLETKASTEVLSELLDEILSAVASRKLHSLITKYKLPNTEKMAAFAREQYFQQSARHDLNPFDISEPGNVVADLVGIEYAEFRRLELRLRVAQMAESLLKHGIESGTPKAAIGALIAGFDELLAIFKSVRGSRSTRAGTSFELHLRQLLVDGKIPHEYQPVIEKRSPDFVLPTLTFFNSPSRSRNEALILTAKTTTRERWMQVLSEGKKRDDWFLASLDRTISKNVIDALQKAGVIIVVPERLKKARRPEKPVTDYEDHSNVISFRTFFDREIDPRRVNWAGLTINPGRTPRVAK